MTLPVGIKLPDTAPLAHFSRRLDVIAWTVESVASIPVR